MYLKLGELTIEWEKESVEETASEKVYNGKVHDEYSSESLKRIKPMNFDFSLVSAAASC